MKYNYNIKLKLNIVFILLFLLYTTIKCQLLKNHLI